MPIMKIALLYGGKSAEHEVSINSAKTVYFLLSPKKYKIFPVYITKKGEWFLQKSAVTTQKIIPVTPCVNGNYNLISSNNNRLSKIKVDVFFPVLHGPFGEDGTVQGMLELLNTAYVGCPVTASAIGMDKIISKEIVKNLKIPVLEHIIVNRNEKIDLKVVAVKIKKMGYPVFVKPVSLGSSLGVSRVLNAKGLKNAFKKVFRYDKQVIIEKAVKNTREIVCGVLGTFANPKTSFCGEITILTGDFYDYESKYVNIKSHNFKVPAKLDKKLSDKIRKMSAEIFKTLKCSGLARMDFLLDGKTKKFYFAEINTIPGLTNHSLYPKLWQYTGITPPELMEKLIHIALKEHKQKRTLSKRKIAAQI